MKKILSALCVASIGASLFAYDIASDAQIKGAAKSVTRTDFSIVSKFGEYFRTPSTKYIYTLDGSGKTTESSELTARDAIVNKIKNTFDASGNLTEQTGFDADGAQMWHSSVAYKNGAKADVSEFGKDGTLKTKTIFTYTDSKLTDETLYNADGALVEKTIFKYDDKNRLTTEDVYFEDGTLYQETQTAYNDAGKKDTVTYFDGHGKLSSKCVFRYAANGTLSEVTTYGPDNQTTARQLVKYDANGNITRITTYTVLRKFGTIVNEMTDMSEFTYSYGSSSAEAK